MGRRAVRRRVLLGTGPGLLDHPQRRAGRWTADYPEPPHPEPPPFTTIGWRLVHVSECKIMYREYAFAQLAEGHVVLRADLSALTDDDLEQPRLTNWGDHWPTWRVFWAMIQHDLHHGGEIGALRDLYRIAARSRA